MECELFFCMVNKLISHCIFFWKYCGNLSLCNVFPAIYPRKKQARLNDASCYLHLFVVYCGIFLFEPFCDAAALLIKLAVRHL